MSAAGHSHHGDGASAPPLTPIAGKHHHSDLVAAGPHHDHSAAGQMQDDHRGALAGAIVSAGSDEVGTAHDRHGGHDAAAMHAGHGHTGHDMQSGHGGHGDHVGQFRRLFWIMLVLAVPTTVLSPMFASIIGYELPDVAGISWVAPLLGTGIFLWGGRPFLTGAARSTLAVRVEGC